MAADDVDPLTAHTFINKKIPLKSDLEKVEQIIILHEALIGKTIFGITYYFCMHSLDLTLHLICKIAALKVMKNYRILKL